MSECRRWRRERKPICNAVPRLEEKDLLLLFLVVASCIEFPSWHFMAFCSNGVILKVVCSLVIGCKLCPKIRYSGDVSMLGASMYIG